MLSGRGGYMAQQETAMRSWVNEAGREMHAVEGQIDFFRDRVDATIHGRAANQGRSP
jgi:hypothetical protein